MDYFKGRLIRILVAQYPCMLCGNISCLLTALPNSYTQNIKKSPGNLSLSNLFKYLHNVGTKPTAYVRQRHPPWIKSFKDDALKALDGIAPLNIWYKKNQSVGICSDVWLRDGRWEGEKGKEAFRQKPTDCNSFCSCRFRIEFTLSGKQRL